MYVILVTLQSGQTGAAAVLETTRPNTVDRMMEYRAVIGGGRCDGGSYHSKRRTDMGLITSWMVLISVPIQRP